PRRPPPPRAFAGGGEGGRERGRGGVFSCPKPAPPPPPRLSPGIKPGYTGGGESAAHHFGPDFRIPASRYHVRSANSRATAARSSGTPAPVWAEVASTSGKAAGRLASAAAVAATRAESSAGCTWSAL